MSTVAAFPAAPTRQASMHGVLRQRAALASAACRRLAGRIGLAAVLATVLPLSLSSPACGAEQGKASASPAADIGWPLHGGVAEDWYYSPLRQITTENVGSLKPAWHRDLDSYRGQEATPIEIDGVLYLTTAWSKAYAFDAATGRELWHFDPKVPGQSVYKSCCDVVSRGPAVADGHVYLATVDGRLIALDARTGRQLWSRRTVPVDGPYSITGAPRAFAHKVIIGNSGGDFGARGYVTAYDGKDGRLLWRFYTVPGDPRQGPDKAASDAIIESLARPTWKGFPYSAGGGGVAWNSITYDHELNRIYIGTGNPYPWNSRFRGTANGATLFACSIVALDADTGRYVWHYQEVPGDIWDFDADEDMVLTSLHIQGHDRRVLLQAGKNGFLYVLDRDTGKPLAADPFVDALAWSNAVDSATGQPIVNAQADYNQHAYNGKPGPGGAHGWGSMPFDPVTGRLFIPVNETQRSIAPSDSFTYERGVDHNGIALHTESDTPAPPAASAALNPAPSSSILAWDPVQRRPLWRIAVSGHSGLLATAGGLLFQGEHRKGTAGTFKAYDAQDGRLLWSIDTPNAILAGAISYSVGGRQFIAVVAGAGGTDIVEPYALTPLSPQPGRLYVFALGGTDVLPPDPPPARALQAFDGRIDPARVRQGRVRFAEICSRCHGAGAQSSNVIPDLKRSPALADAQLWQSIVIKGALANLGMVSWRHVLTPDAAEDIRHYVGEQARRAALAQGGASP